MQFTKGLNKTKTQREVGFIYLIGTLILSSPFWCSWFSGIQTCRQKTTPRVPQVLRLPNYTTSSPGSPACRWQIMEPLILQHKPIPCMCTHTDLLVLCFWRTLMHHESACINKFCFTAEWQLINVEKVMEMETLIWQPSQKWKDISVILE